VRTPAAELLASGHRNPTNSTERPERPAGAAVALAADAENTRRLAPAKTGEATGAPA
jgi:hypothetical protein